MTSKPDVASLMKSKRAFQSDQLRTKFRGWHLIATRRAVTGIKGKKTFEIDRILGGFDAAIRAGKAEIDKLEGPQVWIEGYTNECLLCPKH